MHFKLNISFERKPGNCFLRLSLRDFADSELMTTSLSEGKFCDQNP